MANNTSLKQEMALSGIFNGLTNRTFRGLGSFSHFHKMFKMNLIRLGLTGVFLMTWSVNMDAQLRQTPDSDKIDSLEKVLDNLPEPTMERLNTLIEYAWAYVGVDPEVSVNSFTETISIASLLEDWNLVSDLYNYQAYVKQGYLGDVEALADRKKSLEILKNHNLPTIGQYIVVFNTLIGMNNKEEALKYGDTLRDLTALSPFPHHKIRYEFSMGYAYSLFGEMDSAINRYQNGLILTNLAPDSLDLSYEKVILLVNLGNSYYLRSDDELALKYLLNAWDLVEKYPEHGMFKNSILTNIGLLYLDMEQYEKALEIYLLIEPMLLSTNNIAHLGNCYLHMSSCYSGLKQYDSTDKYLAKAKEIYTELDNGTGLMEVFDAYGELAYYRGNFDESEDYYLEVYEKAQDIPFLLTKSVYYLGYLQLEKADYEKAKSYTLKCIELASTHQFLNYLSSGYKLQSEIYTANNQPEKGVIAFKQYKIVEDSINSEEERNRFNELNVQYETGKREKEIRNQQAMLVKSNLTLKSERKFRYGMMAGLGLIAVIGVFTIFTYRSRQHSLRALMKQNEILAKAELKGQISELKLLALRAQMSPGFLFNIINAIKKDIENSNSESAYDSISKFSKLIQYILECTKKDFVSLAEETRFLALYTTLEKMGLGINFDFHVTIPEEVAIKDLYIPPMIIQPFLEEAIHNRLSGKSGIDFLYIGFALQGNNIICMITDNGLTEINEKVSGSRNKGRPISFHDHFTGNQAFILSEGKVVEDNNLYKVELRLPTYSFS